MDAGISREDAYVIVQRNAMKVWEDIQNAVDGPTYRERLEADDEAMALLSQEKLDEIFDPWDIPHPQRRGVRPPAGAGVLVGYRHTYMEGPWR